MWRVRPLPHSCPKNPQFHGQGFSLPLSNPPSIPNSVVHPRILPANFPEELGSGNHHPPYVNHQMIAASQAG